MKRKLLIVAVVVGVMALLTSTFAFGMSVWADDFELYPDGTVMQYVNGWKGWWGDPAAAGVISTAQAHSGSNSISISGTQDTVHEFDAFNFTSGEWDIRAWTYVPSTMTGQQYFIVLNSYDDAGTNMNWSTQILMDATNNLISADGMIFSGSTTLVEDQWAELRINVNLATDTQTLYYNGTSFGSGSWTEGSSGGGALKIDTIDLWGNSASTMYYDDISITPAGFTISNSIAADLTVSDDGSCGASNTISVPDNTVVTYCYQVTNTGNITYNTHLVENQSGTVLPPTAYDLAPGASYAFTENVTFVSGVATTVMTWTAGISGTGIVAADVATATVTSQPTDVVLTSFAGGDSTVWVLPLVSMAVLVVLAAAMVLRRRFQN